jgi:phosphoglycerate kinase
MGVFEFPKFATGTISIANTLAQLTPKVCVEGGGGGLALLDC